MVIEKFTYEEMMKLKQKEIGSPVITGWFRNKKTGEYQKHLPILETHNFEAVE